MKISKEFETYFSYNQIMVYDISVTLPGCFWTEYHVKKGFARRESTINFGTIIEFGTALIKVHNQPFKMESRFERIIAVPFYSPTGEIIISGPEEYQTQKEIIIEIGHYRVVFAQWVINNEKEGFELYFEKIIKPQISSEIILADEDLTPLDILLEYAEMA